MNYFDAILYKYPGIEHVSYWYTQKDGTAWLDPYDGLIWENKDIPKPSKEDLKQWVKDYDLQYRQQQAVALRVYPSVGDQLDMLYKDKLNNTNTWFDAIAAVKASHPKPTS
jgi:hypothetical protein